MKYRPDFTIMTPLGEKIYREHLGAMNDEDYRRRTYAKITNYYRNHILPPDNLILTMEDAGGVINIAAIDRMIKGQLLPLFS